MVERVQLRPEVRYVPARRVKINFPPPVEFEWRGAFEGWARNWVARNFWRVRAVLISEEDAVQECALIFARCCKTYRGKIDNPAWMMALFKRAVANQWHSYSVKDSGMRALPPPDDEELVDHNHGFFLTAMGECSEEVKMVFKAIAGAPAEFLDILLGHSDALASPDPAVAKKAHALFNRRCRRLLGIANPAVDIVSELRALLS